MWKTLVTIALSDLFSASIFCKPFSTIIFNRFYRRLDHAKSEDQGGFGCSYWIILTTYRFLEQMLGVGVSICVSRQWNLWGHLTREHTSFNGTPSKNVVSNHNTSACRGCYPRKHERDSLGTQRKRHVRDNEENETGWSFVQLALQHSAPNDIWKCCGMLAKNERHGHTFGSFSVWLLHKPVFCWRRALVLCFAGAAPKMMRDFKQSTESAGLDIDPDKTKISQQTKYIHTQAISGDEQHRSSDYLRVRVRHVLGKQVRFSNRKSRDHKFESELVQHRAPDTNKSWHQDRASCNTDSAYSTWRITPTLSYVSGTLTPSKEQRLIRSTQCKMLRFNYQKKRKYRNKTRTIKKEKD